MTTPYLNATELSASQIDAYITSNELDRILERAICGRITINFASDADHTLDVDTGAGTEEWRDAIMTLTDTGVVLTGGVDLIFPDEEGPIYTIYNDTAETVTLKVLGQSGVAILAGASNRYLHRGGDIVAAP